MVRLFTIGYTKKSAEIFFGILKENKIEKLIDIRESNTNVYAGYTMKQNLPFFLSKMRGICFL